MAFDLRPAPLDFHRRAFVLLEAMIAVAVFAIGVIALGRCVENCLAADMMKEDDARARLALANELALVESGAKVSNGTTTEELKGMFAGMKLKTTRTAVQEKNEKDQDIFGVFEVSLEVAWMSAGQKQSKELSFYLYPRQR